MNQFQGENLDPYDWTIDKVIAEIAPDDKPLAESLRANDVDGEVLLTVCTYERLKDDIGVISLGRRSKIIRTIEGFRKRSSKYADHILELACGTALPDDTGSVATYSPKAIRSLEIPGFGTPTGSRKRKSGFLDGPLTSPLRLSVTPEPLSPSPLLPPPEAPFGVRRKRAKPLCLLASGDDSLPLFVPESALHFADHAAVRIVRNEETGVGDTVPYSQELAVSESPSIDGMDVDVGINHHLASPTGRLPGDHEQYEHGGEVDMAMGISPEPSLTEDWEDQNEQGEEQDNASRKDLAEIGKPSTSCVSGIVEENEEPVPSKVDSKEPKMAKRTSRKRHYLPVKGLTVDEIIYGKIEVGDEIPSEEEDGEFFMVSLNKHLGQQRYVARQIRHLLQTPESATVVHRGHLRTGIKPYSENLVLKHHHQAVTLFAAQADGSCRVSRQNTSTVELPWATSRGTQASSSDTQIVRFQEQPDRPQAKLNVEDNSIHDWDYLTKWQNIPEDEELPLFGDSGSEGEYSVGTWADMEAEWGPQEKSIGKTRREPLTVEEVQQVLTDGVRLIVENWREKVLPRKEVQAWRLYHAAKKNKERKKTARNARVRIRELDERLEKMRDEVCSITWTHKGNVKKQVRILQPTVQDREEQRWLADLMERKKTPQRPEKVAGRERAIVEKREEGEELDLDDGDDEESLGSTSEEGYSGDEDEEMDGFIVPDTEKDVVGGVEVEVEGEKEVEEELARKAAENELIDSDEGSDDDAPAQIRKAKERENKGKGPEEEVQSEQEDQPIASMDEDEAGDTTAEETVLTPILDKGKGKAIDKSPPPPVKQEPSAVPQVNKEPASKREIPIIDLTMDESPERPKGKALEPRKSLGEIQHIDLSDEEPTATKGTPQSIVAQLVRETSQNKREAIWYRIEEFHIHDLFAMATVFARQLHAKKIQNVAGLDEYDHLSDVNETWGLKLEARYNAQVYRPITQYYVAWVLGKTDNKKLSPLQLKEIDDLKKFTRFRVDLIEILKPYMDTGISQGSGSPSNLGSNNGKGDKVKSGISRKVGFESDSEMTPTGHRKRPRKDVVEDPAARAKREQLDKTMKNMQRRAKYEEKRIRLTGVENDVDKIRINIGKYAKDNDIFFHPSLAASLKQHQIEGIRFMWQQLVQTGEDRGALLAHTMGLGKTLQVIALLYTLATAARSPDKRTYDQIPVQLRVSKSLVLSPPGLVENWWDEFRKWLPVDPDTQELDLDNIGEIIRADGTIPYYERLRNIEKWYKTGGVLLMGYQTFRLLVLNSRDLEEKEHARIKHMLLDGPNIIVADEAHQLKNPTAKIYEAARSFRSMSRIAMTGSPLSNNLLEYWSMIDWIDPEFLGPRKEFEQKYVQPINDGLYADSSNPEKRKCLTMLAVLKSDIGPKVHRMDISVIADDLPPKTEFLIKVPLTRLQLKMYKRFLRDPTTTGRMGDIDIKEVSGGRFFDVIHLMSLICNHPLCFVETLEARETGNQEARTRSTRRPSGNNLLDDELEDLDDPDAANNKFMDDLLSETNQIYPWAREILSSVDDGSSLEHSYKMMLVKNIIDCTIKAGDQLLLFTHSVMTLSFLEKLLEKWQCQFQKLDGKTPMNTRQAITKKFNSGEGGSVCLISTEAGGLGLNLPGANRIIIFDFKWSPMWEEQAVGRGFRLGQKKHVFVYRFHACGTYEEIMRNKVLFKNQLHSRVVDKRDPIRYATKNGKQYFAEPYDVPKEDLTEFKGKDPQVLDHIIEQVDYIRSIQLTETFQRDENDELTEEELRNAKEILQAEQDSRKAQSHQNDVARKANDAARKAEDDSRKRTEQSAFARQAELQIEQERLAGSMRLFDAALNLPVTPSIKTGTHAPVTIKGTAAVVPSGLVRNKNVPNTTPGVAGKDQDAPPPRSVSSASKLTAPVTPQGAATLSPGLVPKIPSPVPKVAGKDQNTAPPRSVSSASKLTAPVTPRGAATLSPGLVPKIPSPVPKVAGKDQNTAPPRSASSVSKPTAPVTPRDAAAALSPGLVPKIPSPVPKVARKDQNTAPPRSASSVSKPTAPVTPRDAAAALSPGVVRPKIPSSILEVAGKDHDTAPPKNVLTSRPTTSIPSTKPSPGPAVPSPLPLPPTSLAKNGYGLNMAHGLPSIFKRAEKGNPDKSDGGLGGAEGKEPKEVASVGTLKLKG